TFFAISRPIVTISGMMSGSSPVLQHAYSGMADAGGGRHPRHHISLVNLLRKDGERLMKQEDLHAPYTLYERVSG
ncbi:hypothetical protein ACETIH_18455, partial [Microvirga arabica]